MLTEREVISTLDMLRSEHLDVRTVTLGLNLFDCASDNFDTFAYRVRSKINRHAKNLVAICNEVGDRYGIPVVNKRITVSPIGTVCAGYSRDQMVLGKAFAEALSTKESIERRRRRLLGRLRRLGRKRHHAGRKKPD